MDNSMKKLVGNPGEQWYVVGRKKTTASLSQPMQTEVSASLKEYSKGITTAQYDAPLRTNKLKESGHADISRMSYAEPLKMVQT